MEGGQSEVGINRLLLGPLPDGKDAVSYFAHASKSDRAVPDVIISTRYPSTAVLDFWQDHSEFVPSETDIISVSKTIHGPERYPATTDGSDERITAVETNDLTSLGVAISNSLSRRDHEAPIRIWFDSITSLIRAIDFDRVFRFLHIVTARVKHAHATAFYLVDPMAHDPQTVTSLIYLFDDVINAEQ